MRKSMVKKISPLESRAECIFISFKCKGYVREHRFHPKRLWRFDFAFIEQKIAIELDGGIFINGGHSRGQGFIDDCEKINAAQVLGWRVFRYTTRTLSHLIADIQELGLCKGK